jgi:hypothetical protein
MELGHRFNTTHFINKTINDLMRSLKAAWKFPDKKPYCLHLDNALPHNVQWTSSTGTNSLGSSILDTHWMGLRVTLVCWNAEGEACEMPWNNERRVFFQISLTFWIQFQIKELVQVFLNRMRGLKLVIATGGEYIEIPKSNIWFR